MHRSPHSSLIQKEGPCWMLQRSPLWTAWSLWMITQQVSFELAFQFNSTLSHLKQYRHFCIVCHPSGFKQWHIQGRSPRGRREAKDCGVFMNMGHSALQVSVCAFNKGKLKVSIWIHLMNCRFLCRFAFWGILMHALYFACTVDCLSSIFGGERLWTEAGGILLCWV